MEILLILPGFILTTIIMVIYEIKLRKPQNKVRFYVASNNRRNSNGSPSLHLFLGKPRRHCDGVWREAWIKPCLFIGTENSLSRWGLNKDDFYNLKWEDEPVEVFLNLED